jgi:predicted dehydrogenase/threonine dehydrogenase-like Zn-dependent dehydrogenase
LKQLLQNMGTGEVAVAEVPVPARGAGELLVATRYSVISAGTERAILEIGRSSLIGKARARPDLARKVVESARTEGVRTTYQKVRGRLGEPTALGYSLAGTVVEAGDDAPAAPGEMVACAGAGRASHAEVVSVPRRLCARVPDNVAGEDAAYATVAAIALHGTRLVGVELGDVVAVVGLGLVGQLTLELLAAAGSVAMGLDLDASRVALARDAGFTASTDAAELEAEVRRATDGRGADGVLVTAASQSAAPLHTGIALARERATVCVVGDVALQSPRAPMFAKEVKLVVSRSYGPGRYDKSYEEDGVDYPPGYVRWTEGRNLEEVLRLMSVGALRPSRLTTHTFDLADGHGAYALLGGDEPSLGMLLRYAGDVDTGARTIALATGRRRRTATPRPRVGVVGAGAFARGVLMPALMKETEIAGVAAATGVSAQAAATRFGAGLATTDSQRILAGNEYDAVVIATRHDSHARYAEQGLAAGKHVFVEKPLALSEAELARVEAAAATSGGTLMVGFNRRFAPLALRLREALGDRGPLVITCRVNAGRLPRDHWTHDPQVGGGRIVGEMCHFIDFACFLTGATPSVVQAVAVGGGSEPREDNVVATLGFGDGSIASIVYAAYGDPSLPKERIEVLGEAGAGALEDFSSLRLHLRGQERVVKQQRDKGHDDELKAFLEACREGVQPWPWEEMAAVTRASFAVRDAVRVPPAHLEA